MPKARPAETRSRGPGRPRRFCTPRNGEGRYISGHSPEPVGYEEGRAGSLIMLGDGPDAMTLKGDLSASRKRFCAILARESGRSGRVVEGGALLRR